MIYKNVKANKNMVGRNKLSITNEAFNNKKFSTKNKGEGILTCSDDAVIYCGGYSKKLISSLISCTNTIKSTINNGKNSLTKKIGDSIGIGGKLLDSLDDLHVDLVNKYDPLLATYNKRILLHEIAEKIMDLAILNTKNNLDNIKNRLKKITEIRKTFDSMKENSSIVADLQDVPDVEKAKGVEIINAKPMYKQLWGSCGENNCMNDEKKQSVNISTNSMAKNKTLINADKNITEGALAIASINKNITKHQSVTSEIKKNIKDLGNHHEKYKKANKVLKKFVNSIIEKNKGQKIDFTNIAKLANKYANKYANSFAKNKKIKVDLVKKTVIASKSSKEIPKNNDKYYVTGKDHDKYYVTGKGNNKHLIAEKNQKETNKKLVKLSQKLTKTKEINPKNEEIILSKSSQFSEILTKYNVDIITSQDASLWELINIRYRKFFIRKNQK